VRSHGLPEGRQTANTPGGQDVVAISVCEIHTVVLDTFVAEVFSLLPNDDEDLKTRTFSQSTNKIERFISHHHV